NLWAELTDARQESGPASNSEQPLILLRGLSETPEERTMRPVFSQLNVQRDALARDFACPWVAFLHPYAAQQLRQQAPDFADFVALWIDAEDATAKQSVIVAPEAQLHAKLWVGSRDVGAVNDRERGPVPDGDPDVASLLSEAREALVRGNYAEVRDLLAQVRLE